MPWEQAADSVGSAETPLGNTELMFSEGLGQSMGDEWVHGIYSIVIYTCAWNLVKFKLSYIDLVIVEFSSDPTIYCHHLDSENLTQISDSVFYTKFFCLNQQRIGKLRTDFNKH
jgi:hypothetical protein